MDNNEYAFYVIEELKATAKLLNIDPHWGDAELSVIPGSDNPRALNRSSTRSFSYAVKGEKFQLRLTPGANGVRTLVNFLEVGYPSHDGWVSQKKIISRGELRQAFIHNDDIEALMSSL